MLDSNNSQLTNGSNTVIAENIIYANSFVSRLKGLLGKNQLPPSTAILIKNCNSIHTFFMKFKLDAVFVDKNYKVVSIKRDIKKNRLILPILTAAHVFEFEGGKLTENIKIGEQLNVETHSS